MRKVKDVLKLGERVLSSPSLNVNLMEKKSAELLVDSMFSSMKFFNGVGISAPQIGVNQRAFVYGFKENPRYPNEKSVPDTVVINPEILSFSEDKSEFLEGCLSIPNVRGPVFRSNEIEVKFFDLGNNEKRKILYGFEARIFQHEMDHLDGVLFIDRVTDKSKLIYSKN
jgi:peptide deformylase